MGSFRIGIDDVSNVPRGLHDVILQKTVGGGEQGCLLVNHVIRVRPAHSQHRGSFLWQEPCSKPHVLKKNAMFGLECRVFQKKAQPKSRT